MVISFAIFAYMDYRYLDVEFLWLTMGDEMQQYTVFDRMFESIFDGNITNFFRIEVYNYGFIWHLILLICVFPFKLAGDTQMAIYIPRIINAIYSAITILAVYKIACLYLNIKKALLLSLLVLLMPGFWLVGFSVKPDMCQTMLSLWCVYFLCKDNFRFSKNYYLAILFFALSLGVAKIQEILFLPMIYLYIFYIFAKEPSLKSLWIVIKKSMLVAIFIVLMRFITNPYLFHPRGFEVWFIDFLFNMDSNKNNHSSFVDVGVWDKIDQVLNVYYFPYITLLLFAAICMYFLFLALKFLKNKNDLDSEIMVFVPISAGFAISILYLFFNVNKTWMIYYFNSVALAILLLIPLVLFLESRFNDNKIGSLTIKNIGYFALAIIILVNVCSGFFYKGYQQVFNKHNKDEILSQSMLLSDELVELLEPIFAKYQKPFHIATDNPSFQYTKLGLQPKYVIRAYPDPGAILYDEYLKEKRASPFIPREFIILNKHSLYFDESMRPNQVSYSIQKGIDMAERLKNGSTPYRLIAQSKNFVVFQNTHRELTNLKELQ